MLAVAFSVSAMATSTATAHIKLVGSNTTYAVSTLQLNEDDARTNDYESGYDAESMMTQSNPYSVLLYSYIGTQPCEVLFAQNLDGQKISLKTNLVDADYTLQFSNVSGRALKLYDNVTGTTVDITEGGSYAFSVEAAQVGRVEVLDRFTINPAPLVQGICFNYNKLQLTKYDGATVEVFADGSATAALTQVVTGDATFEIDLSALASGKYKVAISGIATPEEYIIDVKPAVTVVP